MLAAWRAVCLAALSAALAATLATGNDAGAGDTVRDFGLVCAVFRNVLQARGVAKAQKARAAEVALAIEHAWLGEAREDLEEAVVYSPAREAKARKAKAKKLKGQAEELAEKIDTLSYSAILGDKSNNQPDKAEDASNVLFAKDSRERYKQGICRRAKRRRTQQRHDVAVQRRRGNGER
ncbi:hypothetical protein ERJ75_000581600 [Trypanosoma vivax]|nr:hypothetical protein ERJ75_000581600 [Trypanosoma vivax]